jgi:hypothetical protein
VACSSQLVPIAAFSALAQLVTFMAKSMFLLAAFIGPDRTSVVGPSDLEHRRLDRTAATGNQLECIETYLKSNYNY